MFLGLETGGVNRCGCNSRSISHGGYCQMIGVRLFASGRCMTAGLRIVRNGASPL